MDVEEADDLDESVEAFSRLAHAPLEAVISTHTLLLGRSREELAPPLSLLILALFRRSRRSRRMEPRLLLLLLLLRLLLEEEDVGGDIWMAVVGRSSPGLHLERRRQGLVHRFLLQYLSFVTNPFSGHTLCNRGGDTELHSRYKPVMPVSTGILFRRRMPSLSKLKDFFANERFQSFFSSTHTRLDDVPCLLMPVSH